MINSTYLIIVKIILNRWLQKSITGEERFATILVQQQTLMFFFQDLQLCFDIFKQPLILIR